MPGMTPTPLAVLTQRDAIRVVALGLLGLVVPALAVLACEGHCDPDVSAGHGRRAPRVVGSLMRRGKGKPRSGARWPRRIALRTRRSCNARRRPPATRPEYGSRSTMRAGSTVRVTRRKVLRRGCARPACWH